jgi:hypothetical protein
MKRHHYRIELFEEKEGFWTVEVWDDNECRAYTYSAYCGPSERMRGIARQRGVRFVEEHDNSATMHVREHYYSAAN